jgi:hypothetical protein
LTPSSLMLTLMMFLLPVLAESFHPPAATVTALCLKLPFLADSTFKEPLCQ